MTPLAATCLTGLLFVVLHAAYGEYSPTLFSLVSAVLAAFLAYGRFSLRHL